MSENFVKLKDQPGFKRLMYLGTALGFVPYLALVLAAIYEGIETNWKYWELKTTILATAMYGSLGLVVYGIFRIVYWVIDGFRQGSK